MKKLKIEYEDNKQHNCLKEETNPPFIPQIGDEVWIYERLYKIVGRILWDFGKLTILIEEKKKQQEI